MNYVIPLTKAYPMTCDSLPSRKQSMRFLARMKCRLLGPPATVKANLCQTPALAAGLTRTTQRLGITAEIVGEIYSDNDEGGVDVVVGVG